MRRSALEALCVLERSSELVKQLRANARVLRTELAAAGFTVPVGEPSIVPLVLGAPQEAMAMCEAALRIGVFAQPIRPATVPEGTLRLRLVAMANHSRDDLERAAAPLSAASPRE